VALFIAASDEASDGTATGPFFYGGWVARERLWTKTFTPDWQRLVLDGPPKIDHLHMVDIKSPKWRAAHGITADDHERRLDAAFDLLVAAGGIVPIVYSVDGGHFRKECADLKLVIPTAGGTARKRFEPDYTCWLHYVLQVLHFIHGTRPDVEQIDFVVERNGPITKHIETFHGEIAGVLRAIKADHLARLVGDIIPGGKDRVPLQAADLLCWHTQAARAGKLSQADAQRYARISGRQGLLLEVTNDEITAFVKRAGNAVIVGGAEGV